MVVNTGKTTARRVYVRVGSVSNPADVDTEARAKRVVQGERIPVLVAPSYGGPSDFSVVVTWRSRLGRRRRWTHPVY